MEARRSSTWSEDETPNTAYTGLNLTYTLKSGTRIDRWYSLLITRDRLAQPETYDYLLDQFVNSDTVKARRLHLDDDFWTVSGGSLYIDTRGEGYELGSREGDAILKAVGRDLTAGNWGITTGSPATAAAMPWTWGWTLKVQTRSVTTGSLSM